MLKDDPDALHLDAKFLKTILNNVLGDRAQLEIDFEKTSAEETKMLLKIYPINPIGQGLQFCARKGVSCKVLTWFFAHVEHRLSKAV